jgi:hypothetical protein
MPIKALMTSILLAQAMPAQAEPIEINRQALTDEADVCEKGQSIVIVRCKRGTFLGCEREQGNYECVGGYPEHKAAIAPVVEKKVVPQVVAVPKQVTVHRPVHRRRAAGSPFSNFLRSLLHGGRK